MNIILVDDEYYARKALLKYVGDAFQSLSIDDVKIFECSSAEEVLEKVRAIKIDVLFTDIRMEQMSGIDLCEKLRQEFPHIILVVISGYGEFSYAQRAIKSHVLRYLIKPVDENEIKEIARSIISAPAISPENGRDSSDRSPMGLENVKYSLILISPLRHEHDFSKEKQAEYLDELRASYQAVYPLQRLSDFEIAFLYYDGNVLLSPQKFESVLKDWLQIGSKLFDDTVLIASSAIHMNVTESNMAYLEASKALLQISPPECIAIYQKKENDNTNTFLDTFLQKLICYYLTDQNIPKIKETVLAYFNIAIEKGILTDVNCKYYIFEVFSFINNCFRGMLDIDRRVVLDLKTIERIHTIDDMKAVFSSEMDGISDDIRLQEDREQNLSEKIKDYIGEHYNEDINLYNLAHSKFFIHPNYLSKILKDATGLGFSKYVLEIRMKNASKLLEQSNLNIATIAQLVGYNSESHFVQMFKKYYGFTPGNIKKSV